jgi:hypothetical protein
VIEIAKASLDPGHDPLQGQLAGVQGQAADVLVIDRQQIERDEERPLAPEKHPLKLLDAPDSFTKRRADDVVFVASTSTKELRCEDFEVAGSRVDSRVLVRRERPNGCHDVTGAN